jgi:hypothetical protein
MKTIKLRWKLYANLLLLFTVLISSFQNCSRAQGSYLALNPPLGVEIEVE